MTKGSDQVKQAAVEEFEKVSLPAPSSLKPKKMSKSEIRLAHIVIDHVYMGVIQQLRTTKDELDDLKLKSPDLDVTDLYTTVKGVLKQLSGRIDGLGVTGIPTVEGLDEMIEKLKAEFLAAAELEFLETATEGEPLQ